MSLNNGWTGADACALQEALRLSQEGFAEHLGIHSRTVGYWHQNPSSRPKSEGQQILDAALDRASADVQARFAELRTGTTPAATEPPPDSAATEAEQRLAADPNIVAALDWLDEHATREPGTARRAVASRLAQVDVNSLRDRGSRRGRVDQRKVAQALADYYGRGSDGYGRYAARFGDVEADTSILTRSDWLDLDCPMIASHDRLKLMRAAGAAPVTLDEEAFDQAVQRLAESLALGVRFVNMPLYRLLGVDIQRESIGGTVGIASFVEYIVTMDLLEGELVDALAGGVHAGELPLRDRYLPDLDTVLDVGGRLTAGGTLALCAFARPADPFRGPADYVLLVQERSGHVINAARRLAVIPKGFHQPLVDFRADAQVGATMRREMEEELFGRHDIDNTVGDQRSADPMHPSRLSEPMRWLLSEPGRLRMECTGFGLNLVSGNFEFPSLIIVDDEEFWQRYGGQIEANWETANLRQYSSADAELVEELAADVAWSNEGLFALLQGLRRLSEIGGSRVNVPTIEWEIR
ncbi:transcriptional regulator [Lentzea alba]|uniref:transcriptional regulator n=1 Tax=Lentzea alba TaxID=2714351 RepID=UPI0039BF04FA